MPPDADLTSIIASCRQKLRRPFKPHWVRSHQDTTIAYDRLPLSARLNIDADFLATRYRQHGRLRAIAILDHQVKEQASLYINRIPVTSQYDACIRFHVNGYHYRNYVQRHNGWDNRTWDSIDFYSFGKHTKRLTPSQRSLHFKFVHDYLPLGERRFREAPVKDVALKLCPCCKKEDETPQHFIRCTSNPSLDSSIATLRAEILNSDIHPVRYLLADGFCHVIQYDTPYIPTLSQYPSHFLPFAEEALKTQSSIGWINSIKGFLAKQWSIMAQYAMDSRTRDQRKGEQRMKQITTALSAHIRRLWSSRNEALHAPHDHSPDSVRSAESAEIQYYHSRPHLLRVGDQHYCTRPLSKILASKPATRRRWLRKVKQSTAELTKDGTQQTLLTQYFQIK